MPRSVDAPTEDFDLVNQGRIFTPYWTTPTVVRPGPGGGANWPPSSYDPTTNLLYVCASDQVGVYQGGTQDMDNTTVGQDYIGSQFGASPYYSFGMFAAVDTKTNKLAWRRRFFDQCYSGSVATSGGLVFVGRNDGRLTALDSSNGRRLWEFQTDAGVNAPASVFEYHGKEMIVVLSAGNLFMGSVRGDSVWMFALDGAIGPVARPIPGQQTLPVEPPIDAASIDLDHGATVYRETCSVCHGEHGEGGHNGKPLAAVDNIATAVSIATTGRNQMPSFEEVLSQSDIIDAAGYIVLTLNGGRKKP
jgi:quinohemoprotein ethanol dehydrogenase